jgi:hypothetical protein
MEFLEIVARALAWGRGRVVPVRATAGITPDPEDSFGIAFIRTAGEERIDAVACGRIGAEPEVSVSLNSLDRSTGHLRKLAASLDLYVSACMEKKELPRVWVSGASLACRCWR